MNLRPLFEPRSIAIIGASRDPKKVGASILSNLRSGGFKGRLYPINPNIGSIQGLRSYQDVRTIRGSIDVAIIAVPVPLVEDMLKTCGIKKIRFVIIVSSGFGETGADGKSREARLTAIARKYRITIVGPNCLGIIAPRSKMNASFAGAMPKQGSISCISQSGALLVSMIDWSKEMDLGVQTLVSIGNQVGVSELDVLEYLARDPHTVVIGMYIEQISDGPRFYEVLRQCTAKKPVVVLKAGVSPAGSKAIASHTGSIAGSTKVISALLRQAGALHAQDVKDFFKTLELFSYRHENDLHTVGIVTNAGGPGVIASDRVSARSLSLPAFSEATQRALRNVLPFGSAVVNPIDLMGDADLPRFQRALRIIDSAKEVGSVIVILTPQRMTPVNAIARYVVSFQKKSRLQIVACLIGGPTMAHARRVLTAGGVATFHYPDDAVQVLALSRSSAGSSLKREPLLNVLRYAGKKQLMPYVKMQDLLVRESFPVTKGLIITDAAQLARVRTFPIALKALSSKAIHKARSGALALNIPTRDAARLVFQRYIRDFSGTGFEGVLAQPMLAGGIEFICGIKRDTVAGLVLLFGIGGTYAEELDDTVLHIGPLSNVASARGMLSQIKHQSVLRGVDRVFIARLLKQLSDFAVDHPDVYELDFNPVKVFSKGGAIIDARIFTDHIV